MILGPAEPLGSRAIISQLIIMFQNARKKFQTWTPFDEGRDLCPFHGIAKQSVRNFQDSSWTKKESTLGWQVTHSSAHKQAADF